MRIPHRPATLLVSRAVVVSLTIMTGCGRDEFADGGRAVAPAATETAPTLEGSPAATTSPGPATGTPDWQEFSVGLPAIEPMLTMQPGSPSFTEQSVRDYIAHHPPSHVDPNRPIAVRRVEFLPVEIVEQRINHPVSVPPGSLLCLVTIKGTWVLPARFQATGTPDPNAVMYLIFDAVTGNYIARTSGIESD
jgi:hypothetical protein